MLGDTLDHLGLARSAGAVPAVEVQRVAFALSFENRLVGTDHEQRAGNDDSWIYDFDARNVGDTLPKKKLGPWDFRDRAMIASARKEMMRNLWKPENPSTGDRQVTRDELAQHNTFDDCWIVIGGKVYDFGEWKDHHPGGSFVARMYAGRDATAEFSDFHSRAALKHMDNFRVGDLVD
jgi:salicylate hydroxylase